MAVSKPSRDRATVLVLCLAGLNCAFQIAWFWRLIGRNINYDAISYIGIARHIVDGNFRASLHGYWSPLFSWLIAAAAAIFSKNFTTVARFVTIASFLICLPLLYLLTFRIWKSPLLAAIAVLWFTLTRGSVAFAVSFIGADFLLTTIVLLYAICLLKCLREPSPKNWLLLGIPHGLAFLAKAFAMPWLALSSLLAVSSRSQQNFGRRFLSAATAIVVPAVLWLSWGSALSSKYGTLTAGYQSRWNLIDPAQRNVSTRFGSVQLLYDTSRSYDAYMVADNMFPGSSMWQTRLDPVKTLRLVFARERQNLRNAIKQILILLTPGGILALAVAGWSLKSDPRRPENRFLWIIVFNSATLLGGYSMLVFDDRYVLPLVPLLIALAVPFVMPRANTDLVADAFPKVRLSAGVLVLASIVFLQVYWASPFRTLNRDYETGCYDAGRKLLAAPECKRLVVIGRGPYQEHGAGWEAGLYASYFAGCRMVAFSPDLPALNQVASMRKDLFAVNPDVVLLLGRKGDAAFDALSSNLQTATPGAATREIVDARAGQVGEVLWGTTAVASKSDGSLTKE